MHYKKGLANVWAVLITVVIMLGLVAGGYYYMNLKNAKAKDDLNKQIVSLNSDLAALKKASSTASTTATAATNSSLKTYTNKTYGYSFQYPSADSLIDYMYDTQTATKVDYGKIVMVDTKTIAENAIKTQSEAPSPYFMVSSQSDHEFGLAELTSGLAESGGELSDVTVDGVAGWKILYKEASVLDGTYSTSIYVNHGGFGISMTWKNSDAAGTHDAAIDAIVKSFKWL